MWESNRLDWDKNSYKDIFKVILSKGMSSKRWYYKNIINSYLKILVGILNCFFVGINDTIEF